MAHSVGEVCLQLLLLLLLLLAAMICKGGLSNGATGTVPW
jgi:hypothetical protein